MLDIALLEVWRSPPLAECLNKQQQARQLQRAHCWSIPRQMCIRY